MINFANRLTRRGRYPDLGGLTLALIVYICGASSIAAPISLGQPPVVFDGSQTMEWAEGGADDSQKALSDDPTLIEPSRWNTVTNAPNLGPGKKMIWYRMSLRFDGRNKENFAFVSTDAVVSDVVRLRVVRSNGLIDEVKSGTAMALKERSVPTRLLVLPFTMSPGEEVTIYLGVRSLYSRNLLYQIMSESGWRSYEYDSSLFFAFFYGVLSVVLAFSIIAFLALREALLLSYGTMVFTTFAASFVGMGFAPGICRRREAC